MAINLTLPNRLLALCILLACVHYAAPILADTRQKAEPLYKILHVMSYHTPWRWTNDQLDGFQDGFGVADVEIKVFEMDTKHNSTEQAKEQKGREARALIEQWQPDLLFTSDDDAQQFVAQYYNNKAMPVVFSGVNQAPATYHFDQARNVTGVVEHEHFVESVKLLQAMVPDIHRMAVVFDDASMWPPIAERMKRGHSQLKGIEIVTWDTIQTYAEYQQKIKSYQTSVDAIALVGIFNFKDENGQNVPYQQVLRWTADNSQLPDLSFWGDRVHYGTLAAVTVSGREQGLAAGRMARAILVDGKSPADIPVTPTTKGVPVISLARAHDLGIKVKSSLLLSTQVIQEYEWQK